MTLNYYLLVQAAVATVAAAPQGISLGAWIALTGLLLTIAGVVFKAGGASQKAQNAENIVGPQLDKLSGKFDTLIREVQEARVADAAWKADIFGRVRVLEGDGPVHLHQRSTDI